jgi:hypothetical protein
MSSYEDGALGLIIFGILFFLLVIGAFCYQRGGRSFRQTLFDQQSDGDYLCRYVMRGESEDSRHPIIFDPNVDLVNPPDRSTKLGKVLHLEDIIG